MGSSSSTCKHAAHSEHTLMLESTKKFNYDGCHQKGTGERYTCHPCKFNLHKQCALPEGTKIKHPLLKNIKIELRFQVPGSKGAKKVCDACCSNVRGFHYASSKLCLHPCCVYPPEEKRKDGSGGDQDSWRKFGRGCQAIAPTVLSIIISGVTGEQTPILDMFPGSKG